MKITKRQLRRIIKETITTVSDEEFDKITMPGYKGTQPGPADPGESEPLDIVDGDTGEVYAQWDDSDNWNDEPFSGMEADFVIWLGKHSSDYTRHPDAQKLSQEHGYNAWWVRDKDTELRTDHRTPPSQLVGKYNLPKSGWGIPEPGRGTTKEGMMKITKSRLQQLIKEELQKLDEIPTDMHVDDQFGESSRMSSPKDELRDLVHGYLIDKKFFKGRVRNGRPMIEIFWGPPEGPGVPEGAGYTNPARIFLKSAWDARAFPEHYKWEDIDLIWQEIDRSID